jgi:hypothetical protein
MTDIAEPGAGAPERLLDLICLLAQVPSFSSFEERIHPHVLAAAAQISGVEAEVVDVRNLLLRVPGDEARRPVALSAHLDKVNHFDRHHNDPLPVERTGQKLRGLLDDAVGVGICLYLGLVAATESFPPLYIMLSELEEGTGLREHPWLLRGAGHDLEHSAGARRLSRRLVDRGDVPRAVITIDLSPRLEGEPGVCLYTDHWEHTKVEPSDALREHTEALAAALLDLDPDLVRTNGTNDYMTYGQLLNSITDEDCRPVVSVALEPSIWPYHVPHEEVFTRDLGRVVDILVRFLNTGY